MDVKKGIQNLKTALSASAISEYFPVLKSRLREQATLDVTVKGMPVKDD